LTIEDFNADFFSIGSNDLIQYVAAASRDEPGARRADASIARCIRPDRSCREICQRRGREVSLCGGMAGEPAQVAALLDQGLRTFSVSPGALGPVKAAIARYTGPAA
jgi:phosphotransferase system enzyme I (PtsI)